MICMKNGMDLCFNIYYNIYIAVVKEFYVFSCYLLTYTVGNGIIY